MALKRAVLIDVDYTIKGGKTLVRLLLKGKRFFRLYDSYDPYFYIDAPISKKEEIMKASVDERGQKVSPTSVEEVTRTLFGKEKKLLKVTCKIPSAVPKLRDKLPHFPAYEYRILFGRRYMIDKGIGPFMSLIYEREGKFLKKIHRTADLPFSLRTAAFDIETYNPRGAPRPKLDPTIMISYANGTQKVITTKKIDKPFIEHAKDEKEMIAHFCKLLSEQDIEVLLGYNSAAFDLPYLAARADILKAPLSLGRDGSSFRIRKMGIRETAEITGRLHIDLYSIIRFLGFIGALKVSKFTLENAYSEITGKKKYMVDRLAIHEMWDKGGVLLDTLADYSMMDAKATLELGSVVMPLEIEMSKLVRLPLFDTSNATAGQLVESLLMHRSHEHGAIIPNKPGSEEAAEREKNPIQGAFVKLPQPGIYGNLAVFDFRGLYPSIITSHNIDPYTLNCDCCKQDSYVSPLGHRFCKKKKGLIPAVLADIISQRAKLKSELKGLETGKDAYTRLFARQQSLKILANSYYGYLAYARSRWYSREAGESVTAWGRHYIQETLKKAEEAGFETLYGDSLPPERRIIVKDENGEISIVPIGEFVESNKGNRDVSQFQTLAFDGKKTIFAPIKSAIVHQYPKEKGGLLEITTGHGRTIVTPQHSVYKYENGVKLADARDLKVGDFLISLTNSPSSEIYKEGHIFDTAKLDLGPLRNMIYLYSDNLQFPEKKGVCPYCRKEAVLSRHAFANHKERRVRLVDGQGSPFSFLGMKNAKGGKVPRYWKLTKELAWLWGYYAAEGSASERSAVHRKEMISFGSQSRKTIEKVKGILEGITREDLAIIPDFDKRISKHTYYYRVQRSVIAALFIYGFGLGKKSSGKRVPEFILSASEELKKAFLEGYFEGDGLVYKDPRYKTHFQKISTKSPELAIGVQYLFKTIALREKNGFGKRIEHVSWHYRADKPGIVDLRFQAVKGKELGNFCQAKIKTLRKIEYAGPVYDLEVEGAHNFVDAEGLILVHNTDSIFLLLGKHNKQSALDFMKKINDSLPGDMELELEAFYPRGVFVTKKGLGGKGAKKKYALIGEDGKIKIRGFELVRRDWSKIAKETQMRVLEAILKEGSKEKAVKIVRDEIERLREGKVPLEDLTIYTQLNKSPGSYEIKSPELSAAQKAAKAGIKFDRGSLIGYVITKSGSTISDKAVVAELAHDYDPNYYIDHQVLPSVLKILKELGFSEDDLKFKGTQKGLGGFFE